MDKVIQKTIFSFTWLFIVMVFLLFLPAWSLSFWQAWLYLIVFFGATIFLTLYLMKNDRRLLESRLNAGSMAEKEKSQKVIQGLASILSIGLIIVPGLDFHFHWSKVPILIVIFSDVFIAIGFLMVFFVFQENSYTSAVIEVQENQPVISTGPYCLIRHPMYSAAILIVIFTPLALGSWVALPFMIPVVLLIIARLLSEEKYLKKKLAGYQEYCQKVRYRLIPYIW